MRQHDFWGRLTKVVEVVGAMSNLDQFGVRYKKTPISTDPPPNLFEKN
jgi:hypothetical protein